MRSPTVKTAISLDGGLFRQAQRLARRMKVSRSRLFAPTRIVRYTGRAVRVEGARP